MYGCRRKDGPDILIPVFFFLFETSATTNRLVLALGDFTSTWDCTHLSMVGYVLVKNRIFFSRRVKFIQ